MQIVKGYIANAISSLAPDHVAAVADDIFDEDLQMYQSEINRSSGAYDISEATAVSGTPTRYIDLSAAIGNNGVNVPSNIRKGGMTVKFINSETGKYEQWRYLDPDATTNSKFTNTANWQGVDDVPIAGSKNHVESGGVYADTHLCNIHEVNAFVADIVLKEGVDDPQSENYIDIANSDRVYWQDCVYSERKHKYSSALQIRINNEWVTLFYFERDTKEEIVGQLLEYSSNCYVVLKGGTGTQGMASMPLTFYRNVGWASLTEHPVIKELLIEGKALTTDNAYTKNEVYNKTETYSKDETYSCDEVDAKIGEDLAEKVGEYEENAEYIRAIVDKDGRFLFGIKRDGGIEWSVGVPAPVMAYYSDKLLNELQKEFLGMMELTDNPEYLDVTLDKDGRVLMGIKKDGEVVFGKGVPCQIQKYVEEYASHEDEQMEFEPTRYAAALSHAMNASVQIPTKPTAVGVSSLIVVSNQSEFDALPGVLNDRIDQNFTNITVLIKAGRYVYSPSNGNVFINLAGNNTKNKPNCSINIVGEAGTVVIPQYDVYNRESNGASVDGTMVSVPLVEGFDYTNVMLDCNDNLIDILTCNKLRFMTELVRLKTPGTYAEDATVTCIIANTSYAQMSGAECGNLYVQVTFQYEMGIYPVTEIDSEGNIYFEWSYKEYSAGKLKINADYYFSDGKVMPRYRLINYNNGSNVYVDANDVLHFPLSLGEVHVLRNKIFLSVADSTFRSICVSGITFNGASKLYNGGIKIQNVVADYIGVSGCTFMHYYPTCIVLYKCSNIEISNNVFMDVYTSGVYSYIKSEAEEGEELGHSDKVYIHDNRLFNSSMALKGYGLKVGCSTNVLLKDNYMENYAYDGISTAGSAENPFTGIIEGNVIVCTPEYYNERMQHSLMDSGGIYIHNYSGDTVLRWNVIVRHGGMGADNGIFCDDGTSNFSLLGNVILDCNNNNSIKSWYRADLYTEHNTNNCMFYNIVNAPIRFEGKKVDGNGCVKGPQILLGEIGNTYNDIPAKEDDLVVRKYEIRDDTVYAAKSIVNALRAVLKDSIKYRLEYLYNT